MNERLDEQLRQFIDGSLEPGEARDVLHAVADDPEARELLRFEHVLQRHFREDAEERSQPVPAGFTDRVMAAVEAKEAEAQPVATGEAAGDWKAALRAVLRQLRGTLLQPRRWRPAYAGALALLLVAASFLGGRLTASSITEERPALPRAQTAQPAAGVRAASAEERKRLVRFSYVNNEADSVAVAGDFTDWQPIPLDPHTVEGKTVWSGMVPVAQGEHRYMFVIDGEKWVRDPLAPVQRDDGFGNKNAVLTL